MTGGLRSLPLDPGRRGSHDAFRRAPRRHYELQTYEKSRIDVACMWTQLPGQLVLFNVYTTLTSAMAKPKISSTSSVSATLGIALRYWCRLLHYPRETKVSMRLRSA